MRNKPPAQRRKFASGWDEIGYLYDKLLYWLYGRGDAAKARAYAERLGKLLPKADPDHEAIFSEECWSLIYETKRDFRKAIEHRENEIRLIRRLHEISRGKPHQAVALKNYGYADLSDRLDLLATLYHDSGNLDRAMAILQESKRLCKAHGIKFDGEDILQEYLEVKGNSRRESDGKITSGSVFPRNKKIRLT
jgi:tetratricopeptide (TPR) repeat protein